jgi:glutathione peroxidase-family protein
MAGIDIISKASSTMMVSRSMLIRPRVVQVFLLALMAAALAVSYGAISDVTPDQHDECEAWAEAGECAHNAGFMTKDCATACDRAQTAAAALDQELQSIGSFFDLSARDIDGTTVDFGQFRGSVTILVNVASYCGYTKSHYEGLVELWSHVESENVQILAFPCNQFGKQEPGSAADIKAFAKSEGVKFRMMEKINVNGPDANIVYKYLKKKAGPGSIQWNFATYFVVGPDGDVQSHSGVEPMELKDLALNLLKEEL